MTEVSPEDRAASLRPKRWCAWSFGWGLAEATFFFIVPDVLITRIALQDFRRALLASLVALAGALLGGTALWLISDYERGPELLYRLTYLPGISGELVAATGQAMLTEGSSALLSGTLRGHPYKLFAIHAGVQSVPLWSFLLVAAGARLARFIIVATMAWLFAKLLRGHPPKVLFQLHILVWLAFYLIYILAMR